MNYLVRGMVGMIYGFALLSVSICFAQDTADQLYRDGVGRYLEGDKKGAISLLVKAARTDTTFAEAYNALGMVYLDVRQYKNAEKALRRAVAVDSNYSSAYFNLGNALYNQPSSNEIEAVTAWRKALYLTSDSALSAKIRFNIGKALFTLGDVDKAINEYNIALETDTGLYQVRYELGRAYETNYQLEKAERLYETAIENDSMFAPAYNALGDLYYVRNDIIDAIYMYRKVVDIDSMDCRAYRKLFKVLSLFIGDISRARDSMFVKALYIGRFRSERLIGDKSSLEKQNRLDSIIIDYAKSNKKTISRIYDNFKDSLFESAFIGRSLRKCAADIRLDPDLAGPYYRLVKHQQALIMVIDDIKDDVENKASAILPQCDLTSN